MSESIGILRDVRNASPASFYEPMSTNLASSREGVLRNAIYSVGTIEDGHVHAIAFSGQSEIGSRPHRELTRSEAVPALCSKMRMHVGTL